MNCRWVVAGLAGLWLVCAVGCSADRSSGKPKEGLKESAANRNARAADGSSAEPRTGPDGAASARASVPALASAPPPRYTKHRWSLSKVRYLSRLGKLTELQRGLLEKQGFFLAPQPRGKRTAESEYIGDLDRATHLFHVYERNDYIAFPSFVTVDLAVDLVHQYFDAVLRDVEQYHLFWKLRTGLEALLQEAERVRAAARSQKGRGTAARVATFWGVALNLLHAARSRKDSGMIPAAVRDDVLKVARAVRSARGPLPLAVVKSEIDLTQTRPRGHYTRSGILKRFFRSMSWLGMANFPVKGKRADVEGIALLVRSWLGSAKGRDALKQVLEVTTFFAGGPDAADLDATAQKLKKVMPDIAQAGADMLVRPDNLKKFQAELATLPPPRIQFSATGRDMPVQVRVMGRRPFEDAAAMQGLIPPLIKAMKTGDRTLIPITMGALGAASVLGSDLAGAEVLAPNRGEVRAFMAKGIDLGRRMMGLVPSGRWAQDAYHGTLHALRSLLFPVKESAPHLLRTEGWRRRALQAFAAGWAELRHDTILYGEQLGAECDAPDPPPPPGWVEPVPELYERLAAMVRTLALRLKNAKIRETAQGVQYPRHPVSDKTRQVLEFLKFLKETSELELAGKKLDRKRLRRITTIGGEVESLIIALSNQEVLSRRDRDMAVVADVFTWRLTGEVVQVGVAHPDLIYAIIPSARGPAIARGAVMSYREFLHPAARRMTDGEWRRLLAADKGPKRPKWVQSIYGGLVRPIKLKGQGVHRCGPMSGTMINL